MRPLAIILSIFIPGVGSFVVGAIGQGIGKILIYGFGLLFTLGTLGIGEIIVIPMSLELGYGASSPPLAPTLSRSK